MDLATIIGIIVGLGSIVSGIWLAASAAGASMAGFLSTSSFAIVFGGMVASVSVAFPLSEVMKLGSAMGAVFKGSKAKLGDYVDMAVGVAEVSRKGAADLEKEIQSIRYPFFRDGVQMVVDGYSLEELTEILVTRIDYREIREKSQADLFKTMGNMAPAWGMIGTLIGLVIMLAGFGGGRRGRHCCIGLRNVGGSHHHLLRCGIRQFVFPPNVGKIIYAHHIYQYHAIHVGRGNPSGAPEKAPAYRQGKIEFVHSS